MSLNGSGWSTPISSTTTLSSPPSPYPKKSAIPKTLYENHHIPAYHLVEHIASQSRTSSAVYLYDVAEQVGFGTLTDKWSKAGKEIATVLKLQTRAGGGLGLIGRLSQGTSHDAGSNAVLTAYTTPAGLASMASSFAYLPPATSFSRLVIQVPTVTSTGEGLALSPSLASLAAVWPILPNNIAILFSATPQQTLDFAAISYQLTNWHAIHLFDHYSSSREVGHSLTAPPDPQDHGDSVHDVMCRAGYSFFEYSGDSEAVTVVVLLNSLLALKIKTFVTSRQINGLGVVIVNVLRPWDEATLQSIVPSSVKAVHVLDDVPNSVTQGNLYVDVFSALWDGTNNRSVYAHRATPSQHQLYLGNDNSFLQFLNTFAPTRAEKPLAEPLSLRKLLFFDTPYSSLSRIAHAVQELFLANRGMVARLLTDYDAFSKSGGVAAHRILLASGSNLTSIPPVAMALPLDPLSNGEADFLAILDQSLLKSHSLLQYAKPNSTILVDTSWTNAEFSHNLPADQIKSIVERNLTVFAIDSSHLAANLAGAPGPVRDAVQNLIVHLSFLRLYLGPGAEEAAVLKVTQNEYGEVVQGFSLLKINAHAWSGLRIVEIETSFLPVSSDASPLLKNFESNTITVDQNVEGVIQTGRIGSWHDAAKHFLFSATFSPSAQPLRALRPEIPDHTYLVTCTVNKRLTPLEYDRNVFHLEFDTAGTGLKYSIGEALGIHGWNEEAQVLDFCAWYGVDHNRLITIPVVGEEQKMHTRTVLQALQQQVDLFGRPPKSFYSDLAEYATSSVDRHALLFIGSPDGSSTFKKMSEKDTLTFADVLKKYPSARPGVEKLCELIGDIKPRHYSIASAQSVVGDRVDLLVVTVDWKDSNGKIRYGQCTRYLAGLRVGQKVTVSIKPSVMKLPPNPKQPIIMAGLGTGAAPFRAFLQHLAWLARNGEEIGPVYYYFGSRHQASEYLYGEEIEAFVLDGVISRAGLAFSRDSAKKVYIQHKMLEDSEALAQMLHDDEGVFYLCGPTWPVPDVYEALVNALVKYKGSDSVKAGEYLESLKEKERYVLEVY